MTWFASFAVLLIITQAPVPVPRQTPNSPTATSSTVNSQRKDHDAPATPPVPVIDPTTAPSSHPHSGEQGQDDDSHSVVISKFPTVSMSKDWADWGLWVFNFLLVVVGALQVVMLLKTLRAIRTQGDHMERQTGILEKSVDAAEKSASIAMNAERAWIIDQASPIAFLPNPGVPFKAIVTLINQGRVPARLTDLKIRFHMIDPHAEPYVSEHPTYSLEPFQFLELGTSGLVIAPQQSVVFYESLEGLTLTPIQRELLYGNPPHLILMLYGLATYNNGFDEGLITQFCYTWKSGDGLRRIGPSGYNEAT
jgi:hypothetical protein